MKREAYPQEMQHVPCHSGIHREIVVACQVSLSSSEMVFFPQYGIITYMSIKKKRKEIIFF
jgi:hypothetical protein